MKEKIKLVLYLASVLLITSVHSSLFYLLFLSVLIMSNPKFALRSLLRILFCFAVFNTLITVSYLAYTYIKSEPDLNYILIINLRVLLLTYLTFFFSAHTNLALAFSFSETFSYLFTITYSQILNFMRTRQDLSEAHRSRVIAREKSHIHSLLGRTINLFFTKSIYNAKETSLAMRSRGLIND
ncbi:MAG: energy-coupling factor transporter transmembrane protein EcfT [Deltaproteobacteria bacterium]|nr:energy-coupling factor transporter transmembrane protein EcfT [Deltaproteobacteria bacterium]